MQPTNKLLIDEPPLQVLPSLAKAIGLNEAIVLQQVHFRLRISEYKRNHRRWWPRTYDGLLKEEFPFWSEPTVRRTIENLETRGLLISTDTWNTKGSDRTKWYSIDYDVLQDLIEQIENGSLIKMIRPSDQSDQLFLKTQEEEIDDDSKSDPDQPSSSSFSSTAGDSSEEIVRGVRIPAAYRGANPFDVWARAYPHAPLTDLVGEELGSWIDDFSEREVVAAITLAALNQARSPLQYMRRIFASWDATDQGMAGDVQRFLNDSWDEIES